MGLHDDNDDGEKKRMGGIIYIWACVTTKKRKKAVTHSFTCMHTRNLNSKS